MPIKLRKKGEPVEPPKEEPKGPSFWDRLGRLPGALATGVRLGSSGVANMGGPIGSAIAAGGEGFAELIEKPESLYDAIAAVPDVVRNSFSNDPNVRRATSEGFVEGAKVPISRMAVEGAIGAVPGASLLKGGKFLISAGKGGAMSGAGSLGRNYANDEPLDWEAAGVNTLLGGAIGGGLGKIIGGPSEAARKLKYQKEVQGPWKAKGLSEPPPQPVPPPSPFKGRSTKDADKIGEVWAKRIDAEDRIQGQSLADEIKSTQQQMSKASIEEGKRLAEEIKLEKIRVAQEEAKAVPNESRFSESLSAVDPEGTRSSMRTTFTTEAERQANELAAIAKAAKKKGGAPSPKVPDDAPPKVPSTPRPPVAPSNLNVGVDVAEDLTSGAIDVRPIPKSVPNVTDRRMNELLKVFGGRRGTDPAEARIGGPRKPIDPPLEGEIGPALPKTPPPAPSTPSIMDEVVQNTPESKLLQLLTKAQTTGEHYKGVKAAALTEPKLKEPLSILDSKGKPYTSERIAGKNARFAAQEAGLPPTNKGPQPPPSVIDPNDQTALNIERALAARKGTGMVGGGETADQVQERILNEYLEAQGKANPLVSMDDPIREFKNPSEALTPMEVRKLKSLGVPDHDIENANYTELKDFLGRAEKVEFDSSKIQTEGFTPETRSVNESLKNVPGKASDVVKPGHPGMAGKLAKAPSKKSSKPDLFEPLPPGAVADDDAPFIITKKVIADLQERGYSPADISSMSVDDARSILNLGSETSALGIPMNAPKPRLIKSKGQQRAQDLGIADDVINPPTSLKKSDEVSKRLHILGYRFSEIDAMTPQKVEKILGTSSKNPLDPKGEKGGIDVGLLSKMLLGGGGALTGAALNPDDPFEGALAGGSIGLGASMALKMLGSLGVNSKVLNNIPQMIEREGIKKAASKLANELPHIQRANYLASGPGLLANAAVGPYMSGVTGAIEAMLKGDSRGWTALKLLMNPSELKGNVGSAFNEAKTLVETAERRTLGEAPTTFARAMAGPGTILTTGDVTIRNILKKAGFSEDEAKLFTMTNEPSSQIGEAAVNFQRTGGPWANMMLPFVRTPMNMLEQGAQRLPVAGGLYKLLKGGINDTLDSQALRDIAAEQALSTATGVGAYGLGASMDQDTAKTARRFVSNAGGRNAFTSNIGFALGQESRKNNSNMGNALARSVASGFALPQTDALQDQIKMGSSILSGEAPELPSGMYPKVLDELFSSSPTTLTDVPSNVPQLRNLRLRKRGQ